MSKKVILFTFFASLLALTATSKEKKNSLAYDPSQGYYKDVFMDSGLALTSKRVLPVCNALNLSMEYFATASTKKNAKYLANEVDTLLQRMIMVGNPLDYNGVLLYPDGAPRFRMIYVNGGESNAHGRSLKKAGLDIIRKFVHNGGSYVGSCAGAFFSSSYLYYKDSLIKRENYLGIWPGCTRRTNLKKAYETIAIEKNSPLLSYGLSNCGMKVDSVRHNSGCYADEEHMWPDGTEVLARFSIPKSHPRHDLDGKVVIWAYKAKNSTGRVIPCGSHPESIITGDRLDLMASMFLYALEGNAEPTIKGELVPEQKREMKCRTKDKNPLYTRIGDKQYHHFTVTVPKKCEKLEILLGEYQGWQDFNIYLFASKKGFAFSDVAQYRNVHSGVAKKLVINHPKEGTYYISVFCATTVDTIETKYGTMYTGRVDVLNGVPYTISSNLVIKKKE